jgi:hypothetical protein
VLLLQTHKKCLRHHHVADPTWAYNQYIHSAEFQASEQARQVLA